MSMNAGLQLFPPPPSKKKPSRKGSTRRNAIQPQSPPVSAIERAKSPEFPEDRQQSQSQSTLDGQQSALDGRMSPVPAPSQYSTIPIGAEIPRSHTSFSEAPTLVRSQSITSHNSTFKPKIQSSPLSGEPIIRSIFPRYNPDISLEQQQYYPTQASPTHIPKAVISKRPYSPSIAESSRGGMRSPLSAPSTLGRFPNGIQDVPQTMQPSTTEELIELWKVTSGWRVSASEGRAFCLKMTSAVEAPVHTLSSDTQPFYTIQLDPTSTSALLTMTRQDPNTKIKASSSPKLGGTPRSGVEVLTTTLEETIRRLPPNDGLVALLYPRAASNMVIDLAAKANRQGQDAEAIVAAAEKECGRLVWDDDTKMYYLVHPASAMPFKVQITSSPAWSRVEYTLEHPELPRNMVKLTRDGAGGGFLEVDTGVAARIDCFYIVDVAICTVLIVALAEEKTQNVERFEAPPSIAPMSPKTKKELKKGAKSPKIDEMEIDLESQDSLKIDKSNLPRSTRGLLRCLYVMFKCIFWVLTFTVNMAAKIIIALSECLTKRGL